MLLPARKRNRGALEPKSKYCTGAVRLRRLPSPAGSHTCCCDRPGFITAVVFIRSRPANRPLPEYIEEFFLSEAVRSEERNELQLTVDGTAFRGRGSSMDGKSAGLDFEYGITPRLQFGLEAPYGIQSTATSEIPVSWSTADFSLLYQFIRGNHPFAFSGAMGVDAPLKSRGDLGYEPELLIAKAFGTYQIHTSVIPEFGGDETSLEYNVAADHPFAHHWIPTLEFNAIIA